MSNKNRQTSSFVVRFTQQIFKGDDGQADVQWRGNISHVQGGDNKSFVDFQDAVAFIQNKLEELTIQSTLDKSDEEREGILSKSFDLFKQMTQNYPKMVMETIKDPKATVSQIKDQITGVGEEIGNIVEIDSWRAASKSDFKLLIDKMNGIGDAVSKLSEQVNKLEKKIK